MNGNHPNKKRKEQRRSIESIGKQGLNGNKYIFISNYLKCQLTECSNQKTQSDSRIKQQKPTICYLQETHLRAKDTYRLKAREWEKIFHASGPDSKAEVAILISGKIDFKMKAIKKDKEGHY